MATVNLMVGPDHKVPVSPQGGTATVKVDTTGGTVYYAENPQVSIANAEGSIAPGASQVFTNQVWLLASALAGVQITVVSADDLWAATSPGGVPASVANVGPLRLNRVHFGGDSYVQWNYNDSTGETGIEFRWAAKIAKELHAEEVNSALGGTSISNANSWVRTALSFGISRTAAPYLPAIEAFVFHSGLNDLNTTSNASKPNPGIAASQAIAYMARAAAVFMNTDASVAYTGASWGTVGGLDQTSAYKGSAKSVATNGDSLTITVPADHTGEVCLFFYAQNRGTNNEGATWDISVDGGAATVSAVDTRDKYYLNPALTPVGYRITGLSAGSTHTIQATAQNITQRGIFGFWTMQAVEAPQVILIKQPQLTTTGFATMTNVAGADITTYNTALDAIAAQFSDGRVQTLDWSATMPSGGALAPSTNAVWRSDGIHPAERIQGALADLALTAWASASFPRQSIINERRFNFKRQMRIWAPSGSAVAENIPGGRLQALSSQGGSASGTLYLAGGMVLEAGDAIAALNFFGNASLVVTPTNQWACVVDQNLNVLAKSADNTTGTAWTVTTFSKQTFTFANPFIAPATMGIYCGLVVVATSGFTGAAGVSYGGQTISNEPPVLAGISTTGLTTPGSLGTTAAAITAKAGNYYAWAT